MNLVHLTARRLKVFVRQPAFLLITLIQPAIWLFLFGNLFRRIVELPGFGSGSYLDFLVPGVVVMTAISSSMWSGMGVLEEIDRGTMNRFLSTPVSRGAILTAVVIEQVLSVTIQAVIIVLLGLLAGASLPGGLPGTALLILSAALLGTIFSALSNTVGMLVRQRETIIGLNTLLLLPLTFLSSAFMAPSLMPGWMQALADANPVNWALRTSRAALSTTVDWADAARYGGALILLAAAMLWLSTRTFRSYQKSV
ncbi:ABC transporter permease [Dactylosporangium sp. AC04546]|uniref:ABC transporter permease n=1 Tax=Dactylosporangium sp. AC04546 TaxID=2862460 RepID=UPI001EDEAE22|nr:ABC transporter permease [Dactylosporangium sp. AC04546]WVK81616.1 ABC transporter permease [Dactylosporangium sp. AC04546]